MGYVASFFASLAARVLAQRHFVSLVVVAFDYHQG
jgi:hypothetical protein